MRRMLMLLAICAGCADDTDAGGGTRTLSVRASVEEEGGNAHFRVDVERAGADVTDAVVVMSSALGDVTLIHAGGGVYLATGAGWSGSYALMVNAGEDSLHGSIATPASPSLLAPAPSVAFDPHLADRGVVVVRWSGDHAMSVQVKTKDFEYGPAPDEGSVTIPAAMFVEDVQKIEIERENEIALAGGIAGSTLSARTQSKTDVIVVNPF